MSQQLLLHFDPDTGIIDEYGHTITLNGGADLSTAEYKFGGGSLENSASTFGDVEVINTPIINEDFTIQCWFYARSNGGTSYGTMFAQRGAGTLLAQFNGSSDIQVAVYTDGSSLFPLSGGTPSLNTWHHFAIVRSGTSLNVYLDGVSQSSGMSVGPQPTVIGATLFIANDTTAFNTRMWDGFIDEVAIDDTALWTSNFTPPTGPYPNPTTATLVTNTNPAWQEQPILLSVTVTAPTSPTPTGPVIFYDGGTSIGVAYLSLGTATLECDFDVAGLHTITASYSGDAYNLPADADLLVLYVQVVPVTTVSDYLGLIAPEHNQKSNFLSVITTLTQPFVDQQSVTQNIPDLYSLDAAVGAQLDVLGQWIGITRYLQTAITGVFFSFDVAGQGFDQGVWQQGDETVITALPDDEYRLLLFAKVAENTWDGTVPGALKALNAFWNPLGYQMYVLDGMDMTMAFLLIGPPLNPITFALYTNGNLDLVPAGVGVSGHYYALSGPLFGFDMESPLIAGFDVGTWLTSSIYVPPSIMFGTVTEDGDVIDATGVYTGGSISLLHFDGTPGSTVFTDVYSNTWSAIGGAELSSGETMFGPTSLSGIPGGAGAGAIQSSAGSPFTIGASDFTYECWFFCTSLGSFGNTLFSKRSNDAAFAGTLLLINGSNNTINAVTTNSGSTWEAGLGSVTVIAPNQWYSVAFVRSGDTFYLFLNGNLEDSVTVGGFGSVYDDGSNQAIGVLSQAHDSFFNGYIDECRISNSARYTSNYTPSGPFPY